MKESATTTHATRERVVKAESGTQQLALVPTSQCEARASSASLQSQVWSSFHDGSRRSWVLNRRIDCVPESPSLWLRLQSRVPARSAIPSHRPPAQARRRGRAVITETRPRAARRGSVGDSGRTAVSRACRELCALPVGGVSEAGLNVFGCQIREVGKNLLRRHSGCEVLQHVVDRYPHAADAGFAAALSRFNGDDVATVHNASSYPEQRFVHYTQRFGAKSAAGRHLGDHRGALICAARIDPSGADEVIQ